jgi:hypothetical protein
MQANADAVPSAQRPRLAFLGHLDLVDVYTAKADRLTRIIHQPPRVSVRLVHHAACQGVRCLANVASRFGWGVRPVVKTVG